MLSSSLLIYTAYPETTVHIGGSSSRDVEDTDRHRELTAAADGEAEPTRTAVKFHLVQRRR